MDNFPFYQVDSNTYVFEVAEGFQYVFSYSDASHLISDHIEVKLNEISFDYIITEGLSKREFINDRTVIRIRKTIIKIITKVIEDNQCSIVYICDSVDDLAKYRDGIFKGWYIDSESERDLITRKFYLEEIDITHYVGIIAYNNSHFETLKDEMDNESLLSEKS